MRTSFRRDMSCTSPSSAKPRSAAVHLLATLAAVCSLLVHANSAASAYTQSTLSQDDQRRQLLITQGVKGRWLVAGKQTLYRFWGYSPATVDSIFVTVKRQSDGVIVSTKNFRGADLLEETGTIHEPNIGVILPGLMTPDNTIYNLTFAARSAAGDAVFTSTTSVQPSRTRDLRFNVVFEYDSAHGLPFELSLWDETIAGMKQMASLLPVRDGVDEDLYYITNPNGRCSGVRYVVGGACNRANGNQTTCAMEQTLAWNSILPQENPINSTLRLRHPFPGEDFGGNSAREAEPYYDLPVSRMVAGTREGDGISYVGQFFTHETAHNLGYGRGNLAGIPYLYGTPHETQQVLLDDDYAFDFILRKHVPRDQLKDAMWPNFHIGPYHGHLSAEDWNYILDYLQRKLGTGTGDGVNQGYGTCMSPMEGDPTIPPPPPPPAPIPGLATCPTVQPANGSSCAGFQNGLACNYSTSQWCPEAHQYEGHQAQCTDGDWMVTATTSCSSSES